MRFSAVCCYFTRAVSLLLLLGVASGADAQSVSIKLMNGKNGRPVANTCVNVWVGTERKEAMAIPTDKEGVARLRLTDKDGEVNIQRQWKNCGNFGVLNPVVRYSDTIGINASYAMCQTGGSNYSWLAVLRYPMAKVLHDGIVSSNTCGKANATAEPGEIILFVRPLTWWEKFKT